MLVTGHVLSDGVLFGFTLLRGTLLDSFLMASITGSLTERVNSEIIEYPIFSITYRTIAWSTDELRIKPDPDNRKKRLVISR